MAGRYDNYWHYQPTTPKKVEGGIKAQSQRGAFAGKWWGKRWLQTLESFNIGARLSRGRAYARKGQVASLEIGKGSLSARVQGSGSTPYKVAISLKSFSPAQWQQLIEKLVEEPIIAARLLGNEMPEELESVFAAAGLPLFPKRQNDLVTDCSCPDWSNPCKHVAAVYYLMAEAFDNDPFLLLRMRGMERDEFLARLRETGAEENGEEQAPEADPVPLPVTHELFWGGETATREPEVETLPRLHAAIPRRLGGLPLWRGKNPFLGAMELLYSSASQAALEQLTAVEVATETTGDQKERSRRPAKAVGTDSKTIQVPDPAPLAGNNLASSVMGLPRTILNYMRSGTEYSRADITAALSLSSADWTWAIRQLKEQGRVVQTGERRGARYWIANP